MIQRTSFHLSFEKISTHFAFYSIICLCSPKRNISNHLPVDQVLKYSLCLFCGLLKTQMNSLVLFHAGHIVSLRSSSLHGSLPLRHAFQPCCLFELSQPIFHFLLEDFLLSFRLYTGFLFFSF